MVNILMQEELRIVCVAFAIGRLPVVLLHLVVILLISWVLFVSLQVEVI